MDQLELSVDSIHLPLESRPGRTVVRLVFD